MRLKLDENLGRQWQEPLRQAGHDVCTVLDQNLCSALDEEIAERCRAEGRALVTLDLDFANPLRFPPSASHGIAVLRCGGLNTTRTLEALIRTLIGALSAHDPDGQLWIVETGRVRIWPGGGG